MNTADKQREAFEDLKQTLLVNIEAVEAKLEVGSYFNVREYAGLHIVEEDVMWRNFITIQPYRCDDGIYGLTLLVQARIDPHNHFKDDIHAPSWDQPGRQQCRVVWINDQDEVQFIWEGNYMVVIAQAMDQLAIDESVF